MGDEVVVGKQPVVLADWMVAMPWQRTSRRRMASLSQIAADVAVAGGWVVVGRGGGMAVVKKESDDGRQEGCCG